MGVSELINGFYALETMKSYQDDNCWTMANNKVAKRLLIRDGTSINNSTDSKLSSKY